MLKKIQVNGRTVPVPVPVTTLAEALHWIAETLLVQGKIITRAILDGNELEDFSGDHPEFKRIPLPSTAVLMVQIDSPIELCIQTLEAIRNLATVVNRGLKLLAVESWQAKPNDKPKDIEGLEKDLGLILGLIDHFSGIVDREHIDFAAIQGIAIMMQQTSVGLQMACSNSDWRSYARLLLNRMEPLIKDLLLESEAVQVRLLALANDYSYAETGSEPK